MTTVIQKSYHLTLNSRAMYSSYAWHQPTDTLMDCGEGVSRDMLSRIFAIRRICFSHDAQDHMGGLISLVGLRAKTKGDNQKSLDLFFPADNPRFQLAREYIARAWPHLPYKLTWYPVAPGFEIQLGSTHRLKAFGMRHQRDVSTLGWKVIESRSRLKPEYRGQDIRALIQSGVSKDTLNEVYSQNTLAYCLDSVGTDPADIAGADFAVFDGTFLAEGDRNDLTHYCWSEVFELAAAAKVKHFCLAHLSTRYSDEQIAKAEAAFRLQYPDVSFQVCYPTGVLEL